MTVANEVPKSSIFYSFNIFCEIFFCSTLQSKEWGWQLKQKKFVYTNNICCCISLIDLLMLINWNDFQTFLIDN